MTRRAADDGRVTFDTSNEQGGSRCFETTPFEKPFIQDDRLDARRVVDILESAPVVIVGHVEVLPAGFGSGGRIPLAGIETVGLDLVVDVSMGASREEERHERYTDSTQCLGISHVQSSAKCSIALGGIGGFQRGQQDVVLRRSLAVQPVSRQRKDTWAHAVFSVASDRGQSGFRCEQADRVDYDYDPIPLPRRPAFGPEESRQRAADYYESMRTRRSVRHFSDRPVERDVIETCLRAAGTAPSGANHQPWHFACVSDPKIKHRIRIAAEKEEQEFYGGKAGDEWLKDLKNLGTNAEKPFLEVAPWLIAIFLQRYGTDDRGAKRKNYYTGESVGIATGLLISALHEAGLATLTHTPNPMKFLNRILSRPDNERPYILLVVGHAADDAMVPRAATFKKPLEEIASFF